MIFGTGICVILPSKEITKLAARACWNTTNNPTKQMKDFIFSDQRGNVDSSFQSSVESNKTRKRRLD